MGSERTFTEDIEDAAMLMENQDGLAERTWERLFGAEATGKTITVKIFSARFETQTRSVTISAPLRNPSAVNCMLQSVKDASVQLEWDFA